jgi:DNA polymerase III delta subunit
MTRALLTVLPFALLAGCGYTLQNSHSEMLEKEGIRTIYVKPLINNTFKPGIENVVYNALIRTLLSHGRVKLAHNEADADAVLQGNVDSAAFTVAGLTTASALPPGISSTPGIDLQNTQVASVYSAYLSCDFTLVRRVVPPGKRKVVWSAPFSRSLPFASANQLDVPGTTSALINESEFERALADMAVSMMKSRELLKRIRKTALGETPSSFCPESTIEGSETDAAAIVDAAQSPALGGGLRLIVVRDAHVIKESDRLAPLLQPRARVTELESVVVFLSKDLDGRKKLSKLLAEKAAVVPCEEIPEGEREAWIQYLCKRRGVELAGEQVASLATLDPWSLDIIDQELEKFSLTQWSPAQGDGANAGSADVLQAAGLTFGALGGAEAFLECFFARDLKNALARVEAFADQPDESLPLLGLLAWNVRQLAAIVADRERGTRHAKINPYLAERFTRWGKRWGLVEIERLQNRLMELDFGFKQTPLLPLGLWSGLVQEFCG